MSQLDDTNDVPGASDGGVVSAGDWNLAAWTIHTGAGGNTGPTGLAQAETLELDGIDAQTASGDGGASNTTSSATWTQCGGVLISQLTCGTGPSTSYLEVLSASTSAMNLYDGTAELDFTLTAASTDGGIVADDIACDTEPTVCSGLPNIATAVAEQTNAASLPDGGGDSGPVSDLFYATSVTLYGEPLASTHSQRISLSLTLVTASAGTFEMAYARDEAFSTRLNGLFTYSVGTNTYTFTPQCPTGMLPFTVKYDSTGGFNLTLYIPSSALDISGDDEAIVFQGK